LPSDITAVGIGRFMHYTTLYGLLAITKQTGRKETGNRDFRTESIGQGVDDDGLETTVSQTSYKH